MFAIWPRLALASIAGSRRDVAVRCPSRLHRSGDVTAAAEASSCKHSVPWLASSPRGLMFTSACGIIKSTSDVHGAMPSVTVIGLCQDVQRAGEALS